MPLLASFLITAFIEVLKFLSTRFAAKTALTLSYVASLGTITLTLYVTIKGLIIALTGYITNEWILIGFYVVWPSNAELCISSLITANFAAFMFRHYSTTLRLVASSAI
ncbi:MAG: minor coat protein [Neisseriaceae bacterium]|nr:minor coat protein [Neisseriaceae bacterium]